jgi:hypothetical protein
MQTTLRNLSDPNENRTAPNVCLARIAVSVPDEWLCRGFLDRHSSPGTYAVRCFLIALAHPLQLAGGLLKFLIAYKSQLIATLLYMLCDRHGGLLTPEMQVRLSLALRPR